MFRRILLISSIPLLVSSCALFKEPEAITVFKYVEKPKLDLTAPPKPRLLNETEFTEVAEDGLMCTPTDQLRSHIDDLLSINEYIKNLEIYIETYRDYYESTTDTQ